MSERLIKGEENNNVQKKIQNIEENETKLNSDENGSPAPETVADVDDDETRKIKHYNSVEQCDHEHGHDNEPHDDVDAEVVTAEERVIAMGSMNHIHGQSQDATGVPDQQPHLHNHHNNHNNHHQIPTAPSSPPSSAPKTTVNTIASAVSNSINSNTIDEDTNTALEMILVNSSLENVGIGGVGICSGGGTDNDNNRLPDVVAETKIFEPDNIQTKETYFSIAIQVFIPFLIAGFGMVGAGLVLDEVQHWTVFEDITELVILVPALLGLKGNLEMTLASRLSTQANLGHMDTSKQQWSMIVGNLTLIQCQAIVVGFLGSVIAIVMGGIKSNDVELDHAYLLCASSLVTVSLASFVLGLITAGVIVLSRHCHINPDNVATPIAASLGDITSLALLSWIATVLYESIGTQDWLAPLIISGYILIIPLWIWIAKKNQHTRDVLYNGWTPVMAAMLISSVGGLILDFMVSRFEGIAVFQPLINGVGGNLVAVQASRISTALHKQAELGILISDSETDEDTVIFISPVTGFCGKGTHARTTRVLMSMVIPGHIIFIYTINYMKAGHTNLTPLFVIVYLCAAVLQVACLMYVAYIMIHWMWKKKIDPDNSAIPYLTSLGDLLGISLLAIAFQFLYLVGDHETDESRSGG